MTYFNPFFLWQLAQIMQVVQQQHMSKPVAAPTHDATTLFSPQTQSKVVYRVVQPPPLHKPTLPTPGVRQIASATVQVDYLRIKSEILFLEVAFNNFCPHIVTKICCGNCYMDFCHILYCITNIFSHKRSKNYHVNI